ncbi:hypothetical protein F5Y16DRAFT_407639 [Xylariaceae sp. FL0255]|nr:hypothetical protein F5Y16DRAFT_407639 [Xylariaceae sp. FL0255]
MGGTEVMVPAKSKRVRTGCLTCRERHLKCDEELPDCRNCRKSNRECKRGVRLNFIDTKSEPIPEIAPVDEWTVEFHDESRLIASEYRGGLGLYAKFDAQSLTPPQETQMEASPQGKPLLTPTLKVESDTEASPLGLIRPPTQTISFDESGQVNPDLILDAQMYGGRKTTGTSYAPSKGAPSADGYGGLKPDAFPPIKDIAKSSSWGSNSPAGLTPVHDGSEKLPLMNKNSYDQNRSPGKGIMTPPLDKYHLPRDYLTDSDELLYIQIFIEEVGIWMDSLDKHKHFSRLVPFYALKCPMLLNAIFACGVRYLALTRNYGDEKALFFYDTATRQLLRCLQNPDRNTGECAATAVVLNVYEIMSEAPSQRMSHISGARALIRECKWSAKSTGLGNACFWLNVGMELLSCLAFNWQTAWDPELWGVNMDFNTEREAGNEEIWVHRMFFIMGKISNFRASLPKFQEPSPHDEQLRVQYRANQWDQLKGMCKDWDDACPRSMHPYAYVHASQHVGPVKSLFPNIWLLKRAAVIGRLYYHMALCILAQVNPTASKDSEESLATQQHHAHQVCGIVAHTKDRGVASVSIRSIALVAEILTERAEQEEVASILQRIADETGWRLAVVIQPLKKHWGWDGEIDYLSTPPSNEWGARILSRRSQGQIPMTTMPQATQPVVAPRPMRPGINPLSFADFSHPLHPYQGNYEPPNPSNVFLNSQATFWSLNPADT